MGSDSAAVAALHYMLRHLHATTPPQTIPAPRPAHTVSVSARLLNWPRWCACCCEPYTTWFSASYTRRWGKRVKHSQTREWEIPCCSTCAAHMNAFGRATAYLTGAVVVGVLSPLATWLTDQQIVLIVGFLIVIALINSARNQYRKARKLKGATCATVRPPVVYNGWDGSIHYFYFRNGTYADLFVQGNSKKVVGYR